MKEEDFDSTEEWHFYNWLLEAEQYGLVSDIDYHPKTYVLSGKIEYPQEVQLKTKTKIVFKHLFHGCSYTPDFQFTVQNSSIQSFLIKAHAVPFHKTIIDIKGSFGGQKNSSFITFPVKAKWMFQKYGLYVEKVVPEKLFKKTFVPEVARLTPKRKDPVKKYIGIKTITDFMREG